jgi:hypothetical protein
MRTASVAPGIILGLLSIVRAMPKSSEGLNGARQSVGALSPTHPLEALAAKALH